ncbi:presequence protease, mitochondrial isoform X1 [Bicyclus anynana]|uniref:Presequence protease, mitochondrial isoform X1 n=1 Tax=Bicyclus anynana TaxID=110368 RepID=A0ABM3LUP2_BICAN|nr:presequence protease, mitochondrial isoform X1 [Bicyclus anynana]XP_052742791.1 presequence protease, mitochondrial isoform X1 [Bicyclus anynana]
MYSRVQNCKWTLQKHLLTSHRTYAGSILKKKENVSKCLQPGKVYHGFVCSAVEPIKEYNMTAYLLTHEKTKTEYLHLDRDDSNNVFSVGFRTTPLDSMGTPHILEHTVLCGSEKYPVRDPFFKMLNRSLATFMNALTGPDYTFYPFSSQNEVDYRNLQKVYLDAVFKPNLSRLDFLQEGWRLEHSKLEEKTSDLVFKGVVYNEMKGAFSETSSLFGQKFINKILPKGTYGYVSGGDPLCIPELTHDHLKNFHATYYHPSNARIYSYGNFPLEHNLKFLNDTYLSNYEFLDPKNTIVAPQERWKSIKKDNISCRVDQYGGSVEKQNQIAIGYVLSDITNIYETFMLTALAELMILGPNSAFYKSLIEKNISGGYNSLTGYDNQIRDTLFVVGLRDVEKSNFDMIEKLVNQTIDDIFSKGFEKNHIESVLHGFELSIKHQSPKFGLNLLFSLMPLWNHNGPILDSLKVNQLLDKLKTNLMNPQYVRDVIEKYFILNNHKLVMTMVPDPKFDDIFNDAEAKLLKSKVKELSQKQKEDIFAEGIQLSKVQKEVQNLDVLPCLKIEEITLNKTAPHLKHSISGTIPLQMCEANTNGVTYFKGVLGADSLTDQDRQLLPFFIYILDKFDTKSYNYRDFDKYISKSSSGISVIPHVTEHIDLRDQFEQAILVSSHCLDSNLPKMLNIWKEIFAIPNFSNSERMTMLLKNYCSSLTSGIIDSGHTYAMQAARSLVSSVDECKENLTGIKHIMNMQEIQNKYKIEDIQTSVDVIGKNILKGNNLRAAFHYSSTNQNIHELVNNFCTDLCDHDTQDVNRINWIDCKIPKKDNRGLHISMNIPVNFCSKVIPTVPYTDPDYPKLRVLSRFITSKYLHPIVREQNGAYGGGAVLTIDGMFNYYSYRDPNTHVTMDVFDETTDWMTKNRDLVDEQNLFEAKLSILQQMDQPIAEHMKGVDMFLYGLSYDIWQTQRERVLAVKKEDLIEVCDKYLKRESWSGKCVIGSDAAQKIRKDTEAWETISGPQE